MGKITIFTAECSPQCGQATELLTRKGVPFEEISLTKVPEWKHLMYILTNGKMSVPEIFFNDRLIGGADELQALEEGGKLDQQLKGCLDGPSVDFPPPLRRPESAEFIEVIPKELRQKWQKDLEALGAKLGGTPEKPMSSMAIILDAPDEMVVVSIAGSEAELFPAGASVVKGKKESKDLVYCQLAIDEKISLFVDNPLEIPGLEKTQDWVEFGYGHYAGAPWCVGETKGTVAALEKQAGILKKEHIPIFEEMRDRIQEELAEWRAKENEKYM